MALADDELSIGTSSTKEKGISEHQEQGKNESAYCVAARVAKILNRDCNANSPHHISIIRSYR